MSKEEIDQILEKKGVVENCRKVFLNNLNLGHERISKETIEILVAIVLEKGCKARCYS